MATSHNKRETNPVLDSSFINSDIRGENFSGRDLTAVDFSGVNTGQSTHGFIASYLIVIVLLIVSALSMGLGAGWFSSIVTGFDGKLEEHYELSPLIVFGVPSIILVTSFTWMLSSQSYNNGILGGVVSFIIAILMMTVLSTDAHDFWLFGVLVIFIANAAIFCGAILGSAIVAILNLMHERQIDLLLLIPIFIIATMGGYVSIYLVAPEHEAKLGLLGVVICSCIVLNITWLSFYIGRTAVSNNSNRYYIIGSFAKRVSSIFGTKFTGADLTEANFTKANLKGTDFRKAKIDRVCWYKAKNLNRARIDSTYLENPAILNLLLNKDGGKQSFDSQDLSGLNLDQANLAESSFIGANLSDSSLRNADLSKTRLAKAQLYNADLSNACLTGAFIEDWAIATNTKFIDIKCDYVYMRLPTKENPDPWRKPDNRNHFFKNKDFTDFITPIIKTLDLYRQPNVDPRDMTNSFKTLDLYHHHGIDPSAASIALKELSNNHPDAFIEVVALEGRGGEKIKMKTLISSEANQSELSEEYFQKYSKISSLPSRDIEKLLASIEEKDDRIRSLEEMVKTAIQGEKIYIETQYSMKGKEQNIQPTPLRTILILAANPKNTDNLRLDQEVRELQRGLERAKNRDQFQLKQRWAATPTDLRRALLDLKPYLVHFSGHGVGKKQTTSNTRSLDLNTVNSEREGLMFEDENNGFKLISSNTLADLFSHFENDIECVVLNACFSEKQAEAIAKHIPYVIGMKEEIGDLAAIKFTAGFYDALLAGNSIEYSFSIGCNSLQSLEIQEHLTPVLKKRKQNKLEAT